MHEWLETIIQELRLRYGNMIVLGSGVVCSHRSNPVLLLQYETSFIALIISCLSLGAHLFPSACSPPITATERLLMEK